MGFDFNYMLELLPILLKYLGTTMEMYHMGIGLFFNSIRHFSEHSRI